MSVAKVRRTIVGLALLALMAFGGTAKADSIDAWGSDGDGQVSNTPVGSGFTAIAGGSEHSLAMMPIPKPSTLALLCMGAVGFLAYGWRRRRGV